MTIKLCLKTHSRNFPLYLRIRSWNVSSFKQPGYYRLRPLKLQEECIFFRWEILICFVFFVSAWGLICQSWSLQGCTQLYRGSLAIYVKLSYTKPQNKVWFLSCLINYNIAQLYQQYLTLSYNNSPGWCHGGCRVRNRRSYANTLDNKIPSLLWRLTSGSYSLAYRWKLPTSAAAPLTSQQSHFFFNASNIF